MPGEFNVPALAAKLVSLSQEYEGITADAIPGLELIITYLATGLRQSGHDSDAQVLFSFAFNGQLVGSPVEVAKRHAAPHASSKLPKWALPILQTIQKSKRPLSTHESVAAAMGRDCNSNFKGHMGELTRQGIIAKEGKKYVVKKVRVKSQD